MVTSRHLVLLLSMGIINIITCYEEVFVESTSSPPIQFLTNPWHAFKMFFSPPTSDEPQVTMVKKTNDLNTLNTAYIYSKYAKAGGRLRMIEELMRAMIEKLGRENKMKDLFFKSRKGKYWSRVI